MSEGFFGRWSRRKQEAQGGLQQPEPLTKLEGAPADAPASPMASPEPPSAQDHPPLPTLEDVQALTPQSDFQPFMRQGVGPQVRNAAMKKLFADPHFNVMDGLDIYIDDYSLPDPMPAGMLAKMASAQFLKLVPEPAEEGAERPAQDPDAVTPTRPATQVVAQSLESSAKAEHPPHDDPDLQLQPDPAPAGPGTGPHPG